MFRITAQKTMALFVLAILLMQFIKPTIVQQTSMEPTLHPHDYLLLNKQAYRFSEPKRGDIVVFHTDLKTETGAEKLLIKRIIGLPGEIISIMDGSMFPRAAGSPFPPEKAP